MIGTLPMSSDWHLNFENMTTKYRTNLAKFRDLIREKNKEPIGDEAVQMVIATSSSDCYRNYNFLQNRDNFLHLLHFLHFHENFLHFHHFFLHSESRLVSPILQHSSLRNHISERNKQRNACSLCPDERPRVTASR